MDLIKLPQFPAVAASSLATLVTDRLLGMSLHALVFVRGGGAFTNAHISGLRVSVDNKNLVNAITGAQLVDTNDYEGVADVTNHTVLFFGDPTSRTIRGQHLGDVDFSVYRHPVQIEVDVGAATTPTLEVHALVGPPKAAMGLGYNEAEIATMRALIRTVIQPSAAVDRKSYGLSLGSSAGARWRRAFFFHTNLTKVELKKQSLTRWDDVPVALNSAVQQYYARTPQSGLYVLDRILDGNQGEAEETVRADGSPWSMEVNLTTSGSDTITAFADLHTTLGRI